MAESQGKHTPGPWLACGWEGVVVNDPQGNTVTLMPNGHKELAEVRANARLISAAPDLLAACEAFMRDTNGRNATLRSANSEYAGSPLCRSINAACERFADAIAKARGA